MYLVLYCELEYKVFGQKTIRAGYITLIIAALRLLYHKDITKIELLQKPDRYMCKWCANKANACKNLIFAREQSKALLLLAKKGSFFAQLRFCISFITAFG